MLFCVLRVAIARVVLAMNVQVNTFRAALGASRRARSTAGFRSAGAALATRALTQRLDSVLVAIDRIAGAMKILILASSVDHRFREVLVARCVHQLVLLADAPHLVNHAGDIVWAGVVGRLMDKRTDLVFFVPLHPRVAQVHVILARLVDAAIGCEGIRTTAAPGPHVLLVRRGRSGVGAPHVGRGAAADARRTLSGIAGVDEVKTLNEFIVDEVHDLQDSLPHLLRGQAAGAAEPLGLRGCHVVAVELPDDCCHPSLAQGHA